jgi:hypothetical protein
VPKVLLVDDKAGRPTGIHVMIGRRPVAAFGNSGGDQQILEYTQAGDGARLKKLEYFSGTYVSAAAEATAAVGEGATAMKNEKGVVIHLLPKTKGVNLKLTPEGVKLTLEKK